MGLVKYNLIYLIIGFVFSICWLTLYNFKWKKEEIHTLDNILGTIIILVLLWPLDIMIIVYAKIHNHLENKNEED